MCFLNHVQYMQVKTEFRELFQQDDGNPEREEDYFTDCLFLEFVFSVIICELLLFFCSLECSTNDGVITACLCKKQQRGKKIRFFRIFLFGL